MIDLTKAVRTEHRTFRVKGKMVQDLCYVFLCTGCGKKEISYTKWEAKHGTGMCRACCNHRRRLRPFESTFNKLKKSRHTQNRLRKQSVSFNLTYDEFYEFTQIPDCHYCSAPLVWEPYLGQARSNLDRKDNSQGYSKTNCVTCCRDCNTIKGARFTYEQMLILSPALKQVQSGILK